MKKVLQPIFNADPPLLGRLEFTAATAIFLLTVLFLPDEVREEIGYVPMGDVLTSSTFYIHLFMFSSIYFGFLLLNFYAVPAFIRSDVWKGVWVTVAVIAALGLAFRRFDIVLPVLAMFLGYTFVRYAGLYLWRNATLIYTKYRFMSPAVLTASSLWVLGILPAVLSGEAGIIVFWNTIIPAAIFFYTYSFHALAPASIKRKRPFLSYFFRVVLVLMVLAAPIAIITLMASGDEMAALGFVMFSSWFHLLVTAPITWLLYKKSVAGKEVVSLKKELGQSVANFDFLRSQINPHFLFNALNTLYGMAILENASRTSEGIQRLGDMMRFMLHENMQEKIPLSREVEYLRNYIALQNLRVDNTPGIRVEATISENIYLGLISPMLLIPFVENAYKHGISFRDPSHIMLSLEVKNDVLYFDIHNSKHIRQGTDPEKDNSGIGLKNVRQRLELLYPEKHELVVRETVSQFFVHLTLQLSL
jgi:two-component system LytT family sensor kinase